MSAFSEWNGPGDVPGDLTLFYQKLKELSDKVDKMSDQTGSLASSNDLTDMETALKAIIAQLRTDFEALKTAYNDPNKELEAKNVTVTGKLDAADQAIGSAQSFDDDVDISKLAAALGVFTHALSVTKDAIWACADWYFLCSYIVLNTALVFDRIEFRRAKSTLTDNDFAGGDEESHLHKSLCPVKDGWYVLAVIDGYDPDDRQKVIVNNGNYGAGTLYFTTRDSVIINTVMHVTAGPEAGVHHGSINATYSYQAPNATTMHSRPVRLIFAIFHGTNDDGADAYYVCMKPTEGTLPNGNVWMIGRNLRRYIDGENIAWDDPIEYIKTDLSVGDSACHGSVVSGLKADGFSAEEAHIGETGQGADDFALSVEFPRDPATGVITGPVKDIIGRVNATFKKDVTVEGKLNAAGGIDFPATFRPDLHLNTLQVDGATTLHDLEAEDIEAKNIAASGDVECVNATFSGNGKVDGDLTVGNNATISGDISASDASFEKVKAADSAVFQKTVEIKNTDGASVGLDVNKKIHTNDAIEADGGTSKVNNLEVAGTLKTDNADFKGKSLEVSGTVKGGSATFDSVTTDTITRADGKNLISKADGVGEVGTALRFNSLDRPEVMVGADSKPIAFMEDLMTGMQFQRVVTAVMDAVPTAALVDIPLQGNLTYRFEVGDTVLVKGSMGPVTLPAGGTYTPHEIYTKTATGWSKSVTYTDAPPLANNGYMIWEWAGYALLPDGLYDTCYIIWNPNNQSPDPQWNLVDLNQLEAYRNAVDQDKIDRSIAQLASMQPDWLSKEPMVDVPDPVPGLVPSRVPNPSFIQNKPISGITRLTGGDWSDPKKIRYDFIVRGGDYDGISGNFNQVLTQRPAVDDVMENVVIQIMHGDSADMPAANANTAFCFKYCTDTKKLYLDTGTENLSIA